MNQKILFLSLSEDFLQSIEWHKRVLTRAVLAHTTGEGDGRNRRAFLTVLLQRLQELSEGSRAPSHLESTPCERIMIYIANMEMKPQEKPRT